jgi:hypothetical protein
MAQFRANTILASEDAQKRARCVKPRWHASVTPGGVGGLGVGDGGGGFTGGMEGGAAQQTKFS